ncbi:MAG: sigma-70 family RNA polymerase sigma factor, partial [Clostridia bacterium]|nr:sigma-70 family RNA polymerase sigma factor [Clostridia bacterium]
NTVPPTRPIRFRPFLAKITRNLAFDKYDEASRKKRIPRASLLSFDELEGFVSNKSTPESELEAKAISEVINSYLKNTSDKKLYIFVSRYFFAIPIAKIAEKLGCSEASVNKCIAEIKKELRKIFESEGIDI